VPPPNPLLALAEHAASWRGRALPPEVERHARRALLAGAQPDAQRLGLVGLQRLRAGAAALEAVHRDAERAQVEILAAHEADLAGAQAVAVGEQEQGPSRARSRAWRRAAGRARPG
jgi:hypothetical protein